MPWIRLLLVVWCHVAAPASAQWTPDWIGEWQYESSPRSASPAGVRVAEDGRSFALIDVGHDGQGHAAIARFESDGAFAWLRERAGSFRMDARLMQDGRIAVIDQFGDVRVRVYDADGAIAWEDHSQPGLLAAGPRRLAIGADGGLLIPAIDGEDFVVIRYTPDGLALPAWRWSPGPENLQADDIVATADGGAVIAGGGDPQSGGVLVIRFAADGGVLFHDRELGHHGTTHGFEGLVRVEVDGNDEVIAASALENVVGVSQAQLWKLAPDGTRRWTRALENPGNPLMRVVPGGFALAADGDALVATDFGLSGPLRVLRTDGQTGEPLAVGLAPIEGWPTGLAQAPNGRLLVTGFDFIDSQGHVGLRIAEFDAQLRPCRVANLETQYFAAAAEGGAHGWTLAAGTLFEGVSNDAHVLRYDADGACTADALFTDGFERPDPTRRWPR
ncbi:MAG: hypothetical protein EOP90_09705 [Lysobacteraceae bacterium]|nr:MAG: hypothetical protein EOP90_09705 [Xanthomonadaceae bacterium]